MLRQLIVTLMGNVDAGKSSIIDSIKKTSIIKSEPGQITQSIKAYNVSLQVIKKICTNIMNSENIKIPGLLFIDTPGHAAFSNLRKRGGSLADIAILVIDINEGIKPQTDESIEILKEFKIPFVIAFNKLDLVPGWINYDKKTLLESINLQKESVKEDIDNRIYNLLSKFYEREINIDRFDRISDYTKTVAVVPIAAKKGEGLPELLMVLVGLAQKFLETNLTYNVEGPGKGTILEIIDEKGLGRTFDTIIYDGKIKREDQVVIGSLKGPIVTKVKALFTFDDNNKLINATEVHAAIGVKIVCPDTMNIIAGMPVFVANENILEVKNIISEQIQNITFELDEEGVIVKADSIGSLEAIICALREKGIGIKRASVGIITKKDIIEATANVHPLNRIILGFRIHTIESDIKTICSDIIYTLIDKFEEWRHEKKEELEKEMWKGLQKPCKIRILDGCIFRINNPAIVGVEIEAGVLKPNSNFFNEKGSVSIKGVQDAGKNLNEANIGEQVAIAMPNITIGRQIKEGDTLYSDMTETEFKRLKELKNFLNREEIQILKEIAEIKRKNNPIWGI
jgi:translation initiation factor 5B